MGHDHHRAQCCRGAGAGDRTDQAAGGSGTADASRWRALPLGRRRDRDGRLGQRAAFRGARQQRAHQRVQGRDVRHPARTAPAGPRAARARSALPRSRGGQAVTQAADSSVAPESEAGGRPRRKLETHSWPGSYGGEAKPRMGFFTDTSVCIGCKACEVACKEWNQIPMSIQGFTGHSYDNTIDLGANTWRHVAFVEQKVAADAREGDSLVEVAARNGAIDAGVQTYQEGDGIRWLMASDVCKHCTHAACLDVCPTGALFRTEYGTVVVQEDVCNGCGYCVPACPFGVLDQREDDGRV